MALTARQIEALIELGASACLSGAVAFAVFAGLEPLLAQPLLIAGSAVAGAIAFWLSRRALASVARGAIGPAATADELLLVDVVPVDVVAEPAPGGQVVRLFDPAAMPAAFLSTARNRHVAMSPSPAASPDASQALHDALAQLRRSLR